MATLILFSFDQYTLIVARKIGEGNMKGEIISNNVARMILHI